MCVHYVVWSQFLAEVLCYLTGNIFGVEISCGWRADNVQMMCGWEEREILSEILLADNICHPHVISKVVRTLSACHLHIIRKCACHLHGMATAPHKAYWLPCQKIALSCTELAYWFQTQFNTNTKNKQIKCHLSAYLDFYLLSHDIILSMNK